MVSLVNSLKVSTEMTMLLCKMFQNTGGKRNASKVLLLSQHNTDTKIDKNSTCTPTPPTTCKRPSPLVYIRAKTSYPYLAVETQINSNGLMISVHRNETIKVLDANPSEILFYNFGQQRPLKRTRS